MKTKHKNTVEPVFGTLIQFMGFRKINTIITERTNKVMQLSAIAYKLKKFLMFTQKKVKSTTGQLLFFLLYKGQILSL